MKYIIETDRLRLREFHLKDTKFIIELLNSPGWLQFIGDRNVKTEQQAINYLENGPIKSYSQNGYGLYLVEKKDDNNAIGMCGILKRENLDNPDIGFAFLPEFSGNGFAYEIANATVMYAKDELNISKIAAITVPDNIRSIKLIEKIGLKFIKTFSFPESNEDLLYYCN